MITKGKEGEKEKETVSPEVNAARNINVGEEERHEEVLDKYWEDLTKKISPEEQKKKQEREDILEKLRVKKMNKGDRAKHQAKKDAAAEKAKKQAEADKEAEKANNIAAMEKKEAVEKKKWARPTKPI